MSGGLDMTKVRDVQASLFPDIAPDKPIGRILPSVFQGTNADLMAAVAPYYLTGSVCDVTYGNGDTAGGWWRRFTPDPFTFHDLALDGVDFRNLPHGDGEFDTVCYDPPYVISGGESSPNLSGGAFQQRFGIGVSRINETTTRGFERLILDGLADVIRVSREWVLVKCMEFSQDGGPRGFHDTPHIVTTAALDLGCFKHDQIVHHTGSGPGGHNIFDPKRARRHHSYLLVFKKAPR